jgi:hypothetical protein
VSSDDGVPVIKDRILYWPTALSAFWYWYFTSPPVEYSERDLHPGPVLILAGPVFSVAIALLLCIFWIGLEAWRRVLSTLILPLAVSLLIYFVGN